MYFMAGGLAFLDLLALLSLTNYFVELDRKLWNKKEGKDLVHDRSDYQSWCSWSFQVL